MANPPDGANGSPVGDEVLRMGKVLSQKFVPEPDVDEILRDLIEAINRFRHNVRWKKFWFPTKEENRNKIRRSERIRAAKAFARMGDGSVIDEDDEPGSGLRPEWTSLSAPTM